MIMRSYRNTLIILEDGGEKADEGFHQTAEPWTGAPLGYSYLFTGLHVFEEYLTHLFVDLVGIYH